MDRRGTEPAVEPSTEPREEARIAPGGARAVGEGLQQLARAAKTGPPHDVILP